MGERGAWTQCQFDDTGCLRSGKPGNPCVFPPGTWVYAVAADLEERWLTLYTRSRGWGGPDDSELAQLLAQAKGEAVSEGFIDLRFLGVIAQVLEEQLTAPSELVTVSRLTTDQLWFEWSDVFERRQASNWPFEYQDVEELCERLEGMGVSGYGLTGWDREDGRDEGTALGLVLATGAVYREASSRAGFAEPGAAPS